MNDIDPVQFGKIAGQVERNTDNIKNHAEVIKTFHEAMFMLRFFSKKSNWVWIMVGFMLVFGIAVPALQQMFIQMGFGEIPMIGNLITIVPLYPINLLL
jgi:hypothetical protein